MVGKPVVRAVLMATATFPVLTVVHACSVRLPVRSRAGRPVSARTRVAMIPPAIANTTSGCPRLWLLAALHRLGLSCSSWPPGPESQGRPPHQSGAGGHDCCGDALLRIVHAGSGGDEHAREHNTIGDADRDKPRRERAVGAVR